MEVESLANARLLSFKAEFEKRQLRKLGDSREESQDEYLLADPRNIEAFIARKKDFFGKLKFSYLEQETKEKFLRGILSDPPLYVEQSGIDELEARNADLKGELKAKKRKVEAQQEELMKTAENVCSLYEKINSSSQEISKMKEEIAKMESEIAQLEAEAFNDGPRDEKEAELFSKLSSILKTDSTDFTLSDFNSAVQLKNLIEREKKVVEEIDREMAAKDDELDSLEKNREVFTSQINNKKEVKEQTTAKAMENIELKKLIEDEKTGNDDQKELYLKHKRYESQGKKLASLINLWSNQFVFVDKFEPKLIPSRTASEKFSPLSSGMQRFLSSPCWEVTFNMKNHAFAVLMTPNGHVVISAVVSSMSDGKKVEKQAVEKAIEVANKQVDSNALNVFVTSIAESL